jgi:thiol-disulfide isomerase/thioredoxin
MSKHHGRSRIEATCVRNSEPRLYDVRSSLRNLRSICLVLCSLGLLFACEENSPKASSEGTKPPARFQAVTVKGGVSDKEIDGFCDARGLGRLKLPELLESSPELTGATWVNVWATWCKSCVEEMPMIAGWQEKLGAKLIFISADEDPEALSKFQTTHPQFPPTLRMKTPEELSDWLTENRIDSGSGLPLHLFVNDKGDIVCARTGAIAEHHYGVVAELLK